jgi:hypothetical protein
MNDLLLKVIDNMRVQSKSQFARLRELMEQTTPEIIAELDEIVDKFDSQKTLNDILYQCCEEVYGVSPEDIHEKSRKRNIVDARGMFITFLFLADGNLTWQRIAQQFDQDHATAIHCTRKFCELYGTDGEYQFNANQFFETLEKYGYNCKQTKKLLEYGQPYFTLKGSIIGREDKKTRGTTPEKISRVAFHCAIT